MLALALAIAMMAGGQGRETVAAIQIHGNTVTTDDEIKRIAAIDVGAAVTPDTVESVASRLRAAKKFQSVQVLKRFASIADPSQIFLVIIVDEGPVQIDTTGDPEHPRAVRTGHRAMMFLPVLSAEDGYGVTYGARFAWPDLLGKNSRVTVPATWGGDKRAAVEIERTLSGGPIDRLSGGVSISRRTNPFYDEDDDRTRVWMRAERQLGRAVRLGGTAGWQHVAFFDARDTFGYGGADITLDTRLDPVLPRNAIYARAAWEHIGGANRADLDARGYVGLIGQNVLALRALRTDSDRPLPPYLKPLLGGMANLRGFRAGTDAADTLVTASAELIVPLTSPLSFGRVGVSAFVDTGTAYDDGERLRDQTWKQGIGGSVWFSAAFVRLNVAIAHGRGSSTRAHVGATIGF